MRIIGTLIIAASLMAAPIASLAQTTTSYTYDDLGRVKTASYPSGMKTTYNYDNADNRTTALTAANGGSGAPLSCHSQYFPISNIPSNAPPISVTGGNAPSMVCSDPNGYTMTTTSPVPAPTFTLTQGQSYSYTISVTDTAGNTGSGVVTYHRN